VSVVNGGHPDALLALGVLAGVLLAREQRPIAAGLAFAAAVSINFTMLIAAGVLAVWAFQRWSRRDVVAFSATVLVLGALPYVLLAGWLATAHDHAELISRHSIWHVVRSLVTKGNPITIMSLDTDQVHSLTANGTTLLTGALVLLLLLRMGRRAGPETLVAAAIAAFMVGGGWVMPWYAFVALPLLALRRIDLLGWFVPIYAGLILVGDQYPSLSARAVGTFLQNGLQIWLPVAALAVFVVYLWLRPNERLEHGHELLLGLGPLGSGVGATDDAGARV
jgi:hypothetical protein